LSRGLKKKANQVEHLKRKIFCIKQTVLVGGVRRVWRTACSSIRQGWREARGVDLAEMEGSDGNCVRFSIMSIERKFSIELTKRAVERNFSIPEGALGRESAGG
jgi:hypothetical protein